MSQEKHKKNIADMTMYDNELMQRVADGNVPLTQRMVDSYFGKEHFKVISVKVEVMMFNFQVNGKDCKLDILAEDCENQLINIEIQNIVSEFPPQRSRSYSAFMDVKILKEKGKKWETMQDTYLIVHFAHDPFGEGLPFYFFERKDQNGKALNDGSHIIYANGEYSDMNTELGKLNHDLKCTKADEMIYNEFKESVRPFKEGAGKDMLGRVVEEMCEDSRNEGIEIGKQKGIEIGKEEGINEGIEIGKQEGINEGMIKGAINTAKSLGLSGSQLIDTVVKSCNTTKEAVQEYLEKMNQQ